MTLAARRIATATKRGVRGGSSAESLNSPPCSEYAEFRIRRSLAFGARHRTPSRSNSIEICRIDSNPIEICHVDSNPIEICHIGTKGYRAWRIAMLRSLGVDRRAVRGKDLRPGGRPGSEIALAWLYVVVWIAVIQIFASGSFSASETSRFIGPLLRWLFPDADAESVAAAHFTIRKLGHFIEYAILALLALRAFRSTFDRPLAWLAAASLVLALAVAIIDEGRQATSASRTGALSDVALDIGGAASALAIVSAVRRFGSVDS
jgi:VanZ family protein